MYSYDPKGVCSKKITFEVVDDKITNVVFTGGCAGNLSGISTLVKGMEVSEVIKKLKGINCGGKSTSCPDQLALALEELVAKA
ncbi:TIGR03905 family TSCPD domain-containing protein [Clostridium sp. CM028]|uniref:TIGR03905 family TSCPD domain-containing protein n=1 Tax=unclassified Clostridium TaxID=2614128 RepID=UPI001C0CBA24|nr:MULTISPECIES: TIGR03905 family TSCPD domain-containing protein [unclassified Clostridium]MBU3092478.1 TIGR03905 family TSCPD domain-containing protein [Clostridium sp. CF011]MBW9146934.1 TIGR03905 family TSCPD domain-containing protein [Clostridium sp. CM027]MBW9148030.1 TIGR03905 family TSCPD domain-containing protein [Clostridium sp. CM028]UVE40788.1 TIGR03905 family TSCPD domain-containing protein [Clostridium sp. CM027]WAG69770.1 TIGR03905 family TSCPD domain-containing protein [Clostri